MTAARLQIVFLVTAAALFVAAILLPTRDAYRLAGNQGGIAIASDSNPGLAACGLAVAGGLSLVAAAIVRPAGSSRPPAQPST